MHGGHVVGRLGRVFGFMTSEELGKTQGHFETQIGGSHGGQHGDCALTQEQI